MLRDSEVPFAHLESSINAIQYQRINVSTYINTDGRRLSGVGGTRLVRSMLFGFLFGSTMIPSFSTCHQLSGVAEVSRQFTFSNLSSLLFDIVSRPNLSASFQCPSHATCSCPRCKGAQATICTVRNHTSRLPPKIPPTRTIPSFPYYDNTSHQSHLLDWSQF